MPEHDPRFDDELARRLRAYESRIPAGEHPPVSPGPAHAPRTWVTAAAVAAAGAVAGAALVGVLLNRPAPPTGADSPSPSDSVEATSTPLPTDDTEPSASETASPAPAGAFTTIVLADGGRAELAASGPNGVAVLGYDSERGALQAWFSPDGGEWRAANLPPGRGAETPVALAASEAGYVAAVADCQLGDCFNSRLWYSADGTSWAETSTAITGGVLHNVIAGGPGFIAVVAEAGPTSDSRQPTILVSSDGRSWNASQPEDLRGAGLHPMVAVGDDVVAIGSLGATGSIATWITSDGQRWERHDQAADWSIRQLAWNGEEIVAVGSGLCPDGISQGDTCPGEAPIAWRSPDGVSWEPALVDARGGLASSVIATPSGWVVVVHGLEPVPSTPHLLGGTLDDPAWREILFGTEGTFTPVALIEHDGTLLVIGEVVVDNRPQAAVLVANGPLP